MGTASGLPPVTAEARAAKAALRYAGKQHRERADMIVNTELAFAYNRGADIGIKRAIKDGFMGRCEMVWTTAGTNRVCGRCLALKDKVVGHTDEDGVTLPPLHPRCRCAIMYREVGEKGDKPPKKAPPTKERQSGARVTSTLNNQNDPFYEKRDKSAGKYYDDVRANKEQWIRKVAEHSGMRAKSLEKVFEHVFIKKHKLRDGYRQFPPDYDMAESFKRLEDGVGIQPHDRILIRHEWLELSLMRRYDYDYDMAHRITERKYDYKTALIKWLKERGDW